MAEQDDVLHLIDDTGAVPEVSSARKWKIAVIDDDQAVHEGTRFALSDYNLQGSTLEILSAYSAAEGRILMRNNPDIAAVLLDVSRARRPSAASSSSTTSTTTRRRRS
jgi:DNA-binding NarL/FixJ family response regulator